MTCGVEFKYSRGDKVVITTTGQKGTVAALSIGRDDYKTYMVDHKDGYGNQRDRWFHADEICLVADQPTP